MAQPAHERHPRAGVDDVGGVLDGLGQPHRAGHRQPGPAGLVVPVGLGPQPVPLRHQPRARVAHSATSGLTISGCFPPGTNRTTPSLGQFGALGAVRAEQVVVARERPSAFAFVVAVDDPAGHLGTGRDRPVFWRRPASSRRASRSRSRARRGPGPVGGVQSRPDPGSGVEEADQALVGLLHEQQHVGGVDRLRLDLLRFVQGPDLAPEQQVPHRVRVGRPHVGEGLELPLVADEDAVPLLDSPQDDTAPVAGPRPRPSPDHHRAIASGQEAAPSRTSS